MMLLIQEIKNNEFLNHFYFYNYQNLQYIYHIFVLLYPLFHFSNLMLMQPKYINISKNNY